MGFTRRVWGLRSAFKAAQNRTGPFNGEVGKPSVEVNTAERAYLRPKLHRARPKSATKRSYSFTRCGFAFWFLFVCLFVSLSLSLSSRAPLSQGEI